jgi:hypothetical protein
MDDILVKTFVLVGSFVVLVLLVAWYTCEPDDR